MFTRVAKVGYILAFCGVAVSAIPVVIALAGKLDGYYAAVLAIGIIIFVFGMILLRQDATARSLGWRVLFAKVLPTTPNEIGLTLAFLGGLMTPTALSNALSSGWRQFDLLFLAAVLSFLFTGWRMALIELGQSQSPQK